MVGRPREFDPETALDAAALVFWEKGYAGASLEELTARMGINRPSLYAAFGDKERLFLACVDRYLAQQGGEPLEGLRLPRLHDALRAFFRSAVASATRDDAPAGCLVACTLVGAVQDSDPARAKLKACIAAGDDALRARLVQALDDGELPAGTDVGALARLLNSLRQGFALRARAGESRVSLFKAADTAVALVSPPAPNSEP